LDDVTVLEIVLFGRGLARSDVGAVGDAVAEIP
jgi:hypothetical protein